MINRDKYHDAKVLVLVFAAAVVARVVLYFMVFGVSRAVRVYPDELRYFGIAQSLFNGEGITIRTIPVSFQKIGYSLVLMPFFALKDALLRLHAIGLVNIVIMNLSVIFAWLLSREIGLRKRASLCIAVFAAIWPDMMYSMTYMSEVVFWPLFLMFMYVWAVNERRQSYILAVLEGIICWYAYLTKEIAIVFLLAYTAFEVLFMFTAWRMKIFYPRKRFVLMSVFVLAFIVCYAAAKLTIFSGMGYSYDKQLGFQALMKPYNFMYMIYAFMYYLAGVLAAGLVVPFIYPAINFKSMNDISRKIFCYMLLYFVITSAVIVYIVSIREHLGSVKPSIILRYYGPAFLVMVMVFFASIQDVDAQTIRDRRGFSLAAIALVMMYVCFMFKGFMVNGTNDHYLLMWYLGVDIKAGILLPPGGERALAVDMNRAALNLPSDTGKVIYLSAVIANLFLLGIVLLTHYYYTRKGARKGGKVFAGILLLMCLAGNVLAGAAVRFSYRVNSEAIREVLVIDKYFVGDTQSDIMYLVHGTSKKRFDRGSRYIDTYMTRQHKFYIVCDTDLSESMSGIIRVTDTPLKADLDLGYYGKAGKIDYIILHNLDGQEQQKLANVELVPELSGKYYTVYKNLNPAVIEFAAND